jgi:hypothetical protein
VKDFLARKDVWEDIFGAEPQPGIVTAHLSLLSANIRRITFNFKNYGPYFAEVEECLYYAHQIENLSHTPATVQLERLEQIMSALPPKEHTEATALPPEGRRRRTGNTAGLSLSTITPRHAPCEHWSRQFWKEFAKVRDLYLGPWPEEEGSDNFLTWTIMAGLRLYASEKILLDPSVTSRKDGRPLLHYAVSRDKPVVGYRGLIIDEYVVETLLRCGANLNELYPQPIGLSAWQLYWLHLYSGIWGCWFDEDDCPFAGFVSPMRAMILHGADVNSWIRGTRPLQLLLRSKDLLPFSEWEAGVLFLLSHGAWLDVGDLEGFTAREEITKNRLMFPQIYDWMNRNMSRFTVPFRRSSSIITNTMQLSNLQNVAGLTTQRTIPGATVATTALREREILFMTTVCHGMKRTG